MLYRNHRSNILTVVVVLSLLLLQCIPPSTRTTASASKISVTTTGTKTTTTTTTTAAFVGVTASKQQRYCAAFNDGISVSLSRTHVFGSVPRQSSSPSCLSSPLQRTKTTRHNNMKRPILDQIATTLFQLETKRVESSSTMDEQGRFGEPMEWSNATSLANQFSVVMASNPVGYYFKQAIANLVAGEYNEQEVTDQINAYIQQDTIVMFSFTSCPFCRKAKDILDERNIPYTAIELDTMDDDNDDEDGDKNNNSKNNRKNQGNMIRAQLGKMTKRTSMPNIFINGTCIGGCNDGYPGLIPLLDGTTNQFQEYIL